MAIRQIAIHLIVANGKRVRVQVAHFLAVDEKVTPMKTSSAHPRSLFFDWYNNRS
jgi:hypothetical protein